LPLPEQRANRAREKPRLAAAPFLSANARAAVPNNLRRELGDEIAELRLALIVRCLRRGRLGEFLEARVTPERIEHRI